MHFEHDENGITYVYFDADKDANDWEAKIKLFKRDGWTLEEGFGDENESLQFKLDYFYLWKKTEDIFTEDALRVVKPPKHGGSTLPMRSQ